MEELFGAELFRALGAAGIMLIMRTTIGGRTTPASWIAYTKKPQKFLKHAFSKIFKIQPRGDLTLAINPVGKKTLPRPCLTSSLKEVEIYGEGRDEEGCKVHCVWIFHFKVSHKLDVALFCTLADISDRLIKSTTLIQILSC